MDLQKILDEKKCTPMMIQYVRTKMDYPDTVLFYRLGDFYEFFFDDAIEMSRVLDLTLTGKDCGLESRAPMCGIPYHAADGYINKLLSKGYKVAICEQTTDPKNKTSAKEIVQRDVVRIVTPGTVIDESLLDDKSNNYIACINMNDNAIGLAYLDITTGEFRTCEIKGEEKTKELNDILVRIMPSEILCNADEKFENSLLVRKTGLIPKFTYKYFENYNMSYADMQLSLQFGKDYQTKFDIKQKNSIIACGVLFGYIKLTQKRDLSHINKIQKLENKKFMVLDINTRRNLEILETMRDRKKKGSLIGVMDKTKTSMGARLLKSWIEQPLYDSKEINLRLDSVEELCSKLLIRDTLSSLLSKCNDIERISGRIAYGNFSPKDCLGLCNTLALIPTIKEQIGSLKSELIVDINNQIYDFANVFSILNNAIVDEPPYLTTNGGFIKKGYNKELDDLKDAYILGKTWIANYEAEQREKTGIKNLKVSYNKVYGYYIEVNKSLIANVPLNYIRKQTVANNERFITQELKALEEKILGSEEASIKLEQQIFADIRKMLLDNLINLQTTAKAIATLDSILSLSELAIKNNYTKPVINSRVKNIKIVDGRHPVIEDLFKGNQFIPNDTYLDTENDRTMIITGPNMAGKSTYMRQVALITLMAHIGSFVPAKYAEISLTDRIFTRVGASDDLSQGQSTFMVEMMEVANIMDNATNNSLIILDEIGRGTSTFDGLSIAWAVVEYLSKNMKVKTLFSTHYHELTELENFIEGVKNYKIAVKELNGNIVFLRKIVRGSTSKSFGIEVAALAGVKQEIIERAKQISVALEKNDSTKKFIIDNVDTEETKEKDVNYTQIVGILKDLDMNKMTPISAFETLCDLVERVKK